MKFILAALASLLAVVPAVAVAAPAAAPEPPSWSPIVRHGASSSTNWGGYAVTGPTGSVSDVRASWVVPAVTCAAGQTSYASFWVGMDGYNSNTVEQTGTDSDCRNGAPTYYAWTEFYPKPSAIVRGVAIHPGDVMFAEVAYSGGRFHLTLADKTTGQSAALDGKVPGAHRSSAEWIAEAPYSGGILPLADFGTAHFGLDATGVAATGSATVGAATGPIGSFGAAVQSITMVHSDGTVKADVLPLSADGTSFDMVWRSP